MLQKKYIEVFKYYCRQCQQYTNHGVLRENIEEHFDSESAGEGYSGNDKSREAIIFQRVECMGCEIKSNREFEVQQNNWGERDNEVITPVSVPWHLKERRVFSKYLPPKLLKLYKESISNFNLENEISCSLTLRTLIEGIGIEEKLKDEIEAEGTKRKSINIPMLTKRMAEKGLITNRLSSVLRGLNVFGNEATHELIRPPRDELKLALYIIEHIFENIYVIEKRYDDLLNMIESRKKRRGIHAK